MRLWYLSHRRPAKAQASLRIRAVSPEPLLFAHMKCGSRWWIRLKIRHLAPLDGWACTFEEWLSTKSTIISWDSSVVRLSLGIPFSRNALTFGVYLFMISSFLSGYVWLADVSMPCVPVLTDDATDDCLLELSCLMTKPTMWLCAQGRLRSAWATQAFFMRTAKTDQTAQADLSSLGAHAILLVLSWGVSELLSL